MATDVYVPEINESLDVEGAGWAERVKQSLEIVDRYKIVYTVSEVTLTPTAKGEL